MDRYKANMINALTMGALSLWMYYNSFEKDIILLVPMVLGVLLMYFSNGIYYQVRAYSNVAWIVTGLAALFLARMIYYNAQDEVSDHLFYYCIMAATTLFSLIVFYLQYKPRPKTTRK